MDMHLQGKVAIITGGGTGIGAAVAERFISEGAKVCITGRRLEKLENEAKKFPTGSVVTCAGDVSNYEDVKKVYAAAVKISGKVDILVNNAALDANGSITEVNPEGFSHVLDVNLTGPFMMMKEAIPIMTKNGGGSIINIASIGGLVCMPKSPAYAASKAGLIHLTRQVALEYGPLNIRCNAVCPGATRTEMLEESTTAIAKESGKDIEILLAKFSSHVPLRRVCKPSEIAGACYFLASDDSSFVTGTVLVVDGGAIIVDVAGASIN
jgi:meso-butanediol dehydrogenase / (S,S)-butanediol dehydrogenase / diacetyl reductase